AGIAQVATSPGARSLMTTEQPTTVGGLWEWRGRVAEGAADALAHALGEDPETAIVNLEIGGVPIKMTVGDALENFTDPFLGAYWGVGDIVLDAVGRKALQAVAPFLQGAARQTVGRLLNSEPVQQAGRTVRGLVDDATE